MTYLLLSRSVMAAEVYSGRNAQGSSTMVRNEKQFLSNRYVRILLNDCSSLAGRCVGGRIFLACRPRPDAKEGADGSHLDEHPTGGMVYQR
jgi:hypothetical protein